MKKRTKSMYVLLATCLAASASFSVVSGKEASAQEQRNETGAVDAQTVRKIEQSIERLSELVPYMKEYPRSEFELFKNRSLIIVNKRKGTDQEFPYVTLFADAKTGEIKRFMLLTGTGFTSTYPYEKAKEVAITFMKKWLGEDMGGYQFDPDTPKRNSSFLFRRIVNGIPFRNDTLGISVDSEGQIKILAKGDGHTESIDEEQDVSQIHFADPKQALAKEKIEQMLVSYMKPYIALSTDGKKYRLLYQPAFSGEILAATGKDKVEPTPHRLIKFQPQAKEVIVKSKEEAAAFLGRQSGYDFTKGRSAFQQTKNPDNGLTNYVWMTEDEVLGSLFFEEQTGKVTSYQVLDTKKKSKAKKALSMEQALQHAIEGLSEFLPLTDKGMTLTAYRYVDYYDSYEFDFSQLYQGYVIDDSIKQAHVDAATGKVTLLDWGGGNKKNLPFPDTKKAITPEEATKKFLKKYPLKLYYSMNEAKNAAELVYILPGDPSEEIDALTGEFYHLGIDP